MSQPVTVAPPKPRVLLVDDEPALVSAFARQLHRHGFDVHGVSDGSRALERILGESFDVVVKGERGMLRELGCDLLQGYLFARPDRSFPEPKNV